MALISEASDDGGDPRKTPEELHKNPQEEENLNENPKEEDHQEEVDQNLAPIRRYIPEVLIESTVALVRRCHYPRLSLLSRTFRHVISSQGLYGRRLQLGLTEPVLYALIGIPYSYDSLPSWYILNSNIPRNISFRLSQITSLPRMNPGSAVVTIGSKMYVIGGWIGSNQPVSTVFVIDCRFHTFCYLPSMHRARSRAAAGVVDGKIYVIGGCEKRDDDWIEVFDVDNGAWSTVPDGPDPSHCIYNLSGVGFVTSVVMQDRIYILDALSASVYEPRQGTWQSWELVSTLNNVWRKPCCVIEDLLYSFDPRRVLRHPIMVYDPTEMVWTPLKGVDHLPYLKHFDCKMANLGGKLMVLGTTYSPYNHTWCIEITLERREGGEIWGKVDLVAPVHTFKSPLLTSVNSPYVDLCLSVVTF